MAEPLGKEEWLLFWEVHFVVEPCKMNHGRLAEEAVLTLSQSEQHKALLRRKN